ncbi:integrase, catalytic region, zinc finger, CCHC-type containing protein, partial [Tanacetum coccineum]
SRDINLYTISLDAMLKTSPISLLSKASKTKSWLWHRRLSHLNFGTINKLAKDGLARGIPRLQFQKDHLFLKSKDKVPELIAMASEQFSSGPGLHSLTPATSNDWDHLFQPMFDEYFNLPSIDVSPVQKASVPRAVVLADSLVSTSVD